MAVDFARQVFDGFSDKTMLAIGAGEMAKLTLVHLRDLKPHRLWITNRTDGRARQLAIDLCLEQPHGVRKFEDLDDLLVEADIVLTATSAAEPILTTERFRSIMKRRRSRPVFIVDIALPRDVEAGVGQLSNVYLYNLDDLQKVIGINNQERDSQAQEAHQLVQEAACLCMSQLQNQDVGRLIRSLRERLHTYGEGEQARTLAKLQSISDAELRELLPELLAEHNHRLINKVLHLPLSQLDRKQPNRTLAFHATALRKLFDLPDGTEDAKVENPVEPVPPKEVIHP
ncbi:MAG: hypothetical protein HC898_05540 [Phycisphaerales bacterium]|nr:hypothetical protein [Phycisphaerales bacterium]